MRNRLAAEERFLDQIANSRFNSHAAKLVVADLDPIFALIDVSRNLFSEPLICPIEFTDDDRRDLSRRQQNSLYRDRNSERPGLERSDSVGKQVLKSRCHRLRIRQLHLDRTFEDHQRISVVVGRLLQLEVDLQTGRVLRHVEDRSARQSSQLTVAVPAEKLNVRLSTEAQIWRFLRLNSGEINRESFECRAKSDAGRDVVLIGDSVIRLDNDVVAPDRSETGMGRQGIDRIVPRRAQAESHLSGSILRGNALDDEFGADDIVDVVRQLVSHVNAEIFSLDVRGKRHRNTSAISTNDRWSAGGRGIRLNEWSSGATSNKRKQEVAAEIVLVNSRSLTHYFFPFFDGLNRGIFRLRARRSNHNKRDD